jgi:hypothetical protein
MINNFLLLSDRQALQFDLASLHVTITQHWVVPKARLLPYWKSSLAVFTPMVWLLILLSLVLLSAIWYCLEKDDLVSSFELHYQILLDSANSRVLKINKLSSRILVCVSVFSFCVISTAFRKEIVRIFTSFSFEHQISSLEDMVWYKVPCIVYDEAKELYDSPEEIFRDYVTNRCTTIQSNHDIADIFLRIASGEQLATMMPRTTFKGLKNRVQVRGSQEPLAHLIPNEAKYEYAYIFFTKGYPLYDRFLQATGRLCSSGIAKLIERQSYHSMERELKSKEVLHSENLTFEEISVSFWVLISGLSVSLVVFSFEFGFKRLRNVLSNSLPIIK